MNNEDRVHFYSRNDMSTPFYYPRAESVIKNYQNGWRPEDVLDIMELYNIWLFVENGVASMDWSEDTVKLIRSDFKEEVVRHFSKLKRNSWVSEYKKLEYDYRRQFWTVLDKFNFSGILDLSSIRDAIEGNSWELRDVLKCQRLVNKFQNVIRELLIENEESAEWLLQTYVEKASPDDDCRYYFPKALTIQDKEDIISRYLDSPNPNLNYVRLILIARKDKNLYLSDAVRHKALLVERRLKEDLLSSKLMCTIKQSVAICIKNSPGKPLKWYEKDENGNNVLCYSKEIMQMYMGLQLPMYFRYGFEFFSTNGMITLVSKEYDSNVFERLAVKGRDCYTINNAFRYKEMMSLLQITSMQQVFSENGANIEIYLKQYYEETLKNNFSYPSGKLSLANDSADWLTKCRVIAPEIDAIAQRYELYSKTGLVDEDLLMLSSDSVKITNVHSVNSFRYYSLNNDSAEINMLLALFFSDQTMLSFVDPFKDMHYKNFYNLLMNQDGKIQYANYHSYQMGRIDYLIEKGYISKENDGMLHCRKKSEILLLKQLYEFHSCPAHIFGETDTEILEEMEKNGWIEKDNHLLSVEERNYFDYYLNNSKYTNGPALRNRYVHGNNAAPDKENIHRNNYYRLLILLILELLKIEDDLIVQQLLRDS